jgi:hypothetical protein
MTSVTPADVVAVLADEDRLRVAAAIVLQPGTTDEIASSCALPARRVIAALARLDAAELARRDPDGRWVFEVARLRDVAREARPAPDHSPATPSEVILRSFVADGRLTQIPAARGKRLVVLDRLAAEFEPGRRYAEREVNDLLRRWYDDVAALRRYLVDESFLSRDHGEYWRSGGTVETADGRGQK